MSKKYDYYSFQDLVSNAWQVGDKAMTAIGGNLYVITAINMDSRRASLRPADDTAWDAWEAANGIHFPKLYLLPLA